MTTEMAIPFRLNSSGQITQQKDLSRQLNQHAMSLVATAPGERVMMSRYGTSLMELLFEPQTEMVTRQIIEQVTTAMSIWEPSIVIRKVTPVHNEMGLAKVDVDITGNTSTGENGFVNRATVHVGGQVVEVIHG